MTAHTDNTLSPTDRPLWPALQRGWKQSCPNCGKGPVLYKYLKIHKCCSECNLDLSAARADDGPAYLTILVVGHIAIMLMHVVFVHFRPEPMVLFSLFAFIAISLSLYLLPRFKGAIIGYQWSKRMFGFGDTTIISNQRETA